MSQINVKNILGKSNSWDDFKFQLQHLSKKTKGDCFEALCKAFLEIHPTYATKLEKVWSLQKTPVKIRKQLNLPTLDEGIDLIGRTKEGEYWAVQCKYRADETKSLTRRELSTFTDLAFNICNGISLGLVCSTADRFSHKLKMYGNKVSFCAGDVWRGLDSDFFLRLHKLLDGTVAPLKPFRPRPHQMSAIISAHDHFQNQKNSKGKMIMPCGTGKSLAAYWIADKLQARKILITVPSLALIRQTLQVWTRECFAKGRKVNWICVCSDESVRDIERDEPIVLTHDLGVRVQTDPNEIAGWLRAKKRGTTVVFTTYQSGKAIAEAARKSGTVFDLGIMDEAHKTVGRKNDLFCHLLFDENIRIKKRIFMTATERRYAGKSEHIVSMDNLELYGETFNLLTFKEALECQPPILSDYKIVTIIVTKAEIVELIEKNILLELNRGKWDSKVEAEMLAAVISLRKAMLKYPIRHAVSYHNSISRAKAFESMQDKFSNAFSNYRELETFHVSGKTPTAFRSRKLDAFAKAKRGLITNARCLIEGVDIPEIDCVLFADPRKSTIDIVQAVGRALRLTENKRLGFIIVPVTLESDDFENSEIHSKTFNSILITLRALAANDDRIVDYFRGISQGHKKSNTPTPVDIDVPIGVEIDADAFINSIELKLWSRLAKLSWRPFEEARKFARSLGLKSNIEWRKFSKGEMPEKGSLPEDIPADPYGTYKDKGWDGWGDWLGTGNVALYNRVYRPFEDARKFARSLSFKSRTEWEKFCKGEMPEKGSLPEDIPATPDGTYKEKGWVNWGDWLGSGTIASIFIKYRSFEEARKFVRSLSLKSGAEWRKFCKGEMPDKGSLPEDIPANANRTYKNKGWDGWGDWLGTGNVALYNRVYRPFEDARKFARSLGLKGNIEWRKFSKGELPDKGSLPEDIPTAPDGTYKDKGWVNWGDWLGTRTIATFKRKYRAFEEARKFARSLSLKSGAEWRIFCRGEMPEKGSPPNDISSKPERTYKGKGWVGMGDWLGTGNVAVYNRVYRPFEEARKFARGLGLKSANEWRKFCKGEMPKKGSLPEDIPAAPYRTYEDKGWANWSDWLDTGTIATYKIKYRPFEDARKFARSLSLKSGAEWRKFLKGERHDIGSLPEDIPASPYHVYKDKGWAGWRDWLGN